MKINKIVDDQLSSDNLLDITGGLADDKDKKPKCICNCFISNTNQQPEGEGGSN